MPLLRGSTGLCPFGLSRERSHRSDRTERVRVEVIEAWCEPSMVAVDCVGMRRLFGTSAPALCTGVQVNKPGKEVHPPVLRAVLACHLRHSGLH